MSISFISWRAISKFLTNNEGNVRGNRVPNKYFERLNTLKHYIECWKQGKRLYSIEEIDQILTEIDIKTTIVDKLLNKH